MDPTGWSPTAWPTRRGKVRFDLVCRELGIRHTRIRLRHPWTNGRVERLNGTLQHECLYAGQLLDA